MLSSFITPIWLYPQPIDFRRAAGELFPIDDIRKCREELEKVQARLSDTTFIDRAKPEVVQRAKSQALELQERLEKLGDRKKLFECD